MSQEKPLAPNEFRERAEALLQNRSSADVSRMSAEELGKLFRELQLRQIELELQNEELRRTHQEASETRDHYSELYESAPVGYVTLDSSGCIQQANLTLSRLLGVTCEELVGAELSRFVHVDDREILLRHFQEVFGAENCEVPHNPVTKKSCKLRFSGHEGMTIAVRFESVPVVDASGQVSQCRSVLIDVPSERDAESALHQRNEELRKLLSARTAEKNLLGKAVASLGEGVLITTDDLDWPGPTIIFVNEAMCRITGYSGEELIGQSPRMLQGTGTDRKTLVHIRTRLFANHACNVELTNYRKDGTPYSCELFITPLFNNEGKRTNFVSIHRDITDRKRSQAELRKAHHRLALVVETAPSLVVVTDRVGRIVLFNRACERLTGYSREEVIRQTTINQFLPPEWRCIVEERFANYSSPEFEEPHEAPWINKSGEERLIEWRCITLNQDDGTADWFVLGIGVDITERKRIEQSLMDSEAQTKSILASLSAHIAVLDRTGQIVAVNPAWEEFARNNQGDLARLGVGTNYLEVCLKSKGPYAERAPEVARGIQAILSGKTHHLSLEYPCHSPAQQRWFLLQASALRSGEGGAVVSHTDITERVRAEQRLRESEERLRSILKTAADAIVIIDHCGIIDDVNPAIMKMFGYTAGQLVGQNVRILMPAPFCDEHDSYLERYLQTGQARIIGYGRELVARRRDGSVFPIELAISHVPHLGLFIGMIRDITKRKELENQLLQIVAEEQRRIGQELHDDLGQELTGISLKLSALLKSLKAESSQNAQLASNLIDDVQRARSKVGALSRGLIPVAVDREGLMVALQVLATRFNETGSVSCQVVCEKPVRIDNAELATQLYHIAQEAITNAVKHGQASDIWITLEERHGRVTLTIRDNGVGIDPDGVTLVRGMGLKIMSYRASLIGGHLTVRPFERGGTIVTCLLHTGANYGKNQHDAS
ncbi:MAG: PAS domain S-box protein [Gemmataceae bacterium]